MSYRLVRLNTDDHRTSERALEDMVSIIDRGFYWKKSQRPDFPAGTQVVGMGSYGGRGLFILGVTTSDMWEREPEDGDFKHRLPVAWARVVYESPSAYEELQEAAGRFHPRSFAKLTQQDYRDVIALVLAGEERSV